MGVLVGLAFAAACVSWIRAWGSPRDPTSWVTGAALVSLASGALIALLGCLGAVSVPVIAAGYGYCDKAPDRLGADGVILSLNGFARVVNNLWPNRPKT